jgi:CheY-like chemotaxis protein
VYDPGAPEWFLGDPSRLRQVLLNLLTNATKFTHQGSITTEVRFDPDLDTVHVAVADTGIGIDDGKLPHLFERFSQADSSTSRRFGGTGLGLAICRSLVELMGGRIGVQSRVGEGSRFWFELPLRRFDTLAQAAPRQDNTAKFRPRRILLAEDNLINQEVISAMLKSRGHSVTMVADGASAVDIVESGTSFDLVLMDVQMPGVDGLHATAAIRRMERNERSSLPIVGLTANAMAEDVERCLAAGMNGHVAKPIDWPTLFAAIDAKALA